MSSSPCPAGHFGPVCDGAAGGGVRGGGHVWTPRGHQEESAEDQNVPEQQRRQPGVGRGAHRLQEGERNAGKDSKHPKTRKPLAV